MSVMNLSGVSDEDLVRKFLSLQGSWWSLRHPLIDRAVSELRNEIVARRIDPTDVYFECADF